MNVNKVKPLAGFFQGLLSELVVLLLFIKGALCEYKCNLSQKPVKNLFQRRKKEVEQELCPYLFLSVSALVDALAVEVYEG